MIEEYIKDLKQSFPIAVIGGIIVGIVLTPVFPPAIIFAPILLIICLPILVLEFLIIPFILSLPFTIIEFIINLFSKKK